MVKKLVVKPEISVLTIGGFVEAYPQELIGIVPVKEYIQAIEIINTNIIRDYQSLLMGIFALAYVGLLPILICGIIELIRYLIFKRKVMKDIKPVIESINRTMLIRNVTFNAKLASSFTCRVIIEVSYPDDLTRSPPTILQQVDGGKNALLLEPFANPQPMILNPRTHFQSHHPTDTNFKNILILNNNYTSSVFRGNKGWEINGYSNKLYNYLSIQEYTEMINDYNTTCMVEFNKDCANLLLFSLITCFILIGLLFVIPASIWFQIEFKKYNINLNKSLDDLNAKYNTMYESRGISIGQYLPNPLTPNIIYVCIHIVEDLFYILLLILNTNYKLNIFLPRDVGNGPTLTSLLPSDQLLIAPTIPGCFAPNYQSIGASPQVALYPIPVQTTTSVQAFNN